MVSWELGSFPRAFLLALYDECSGESYTLIIVNLSSSCGNIVTAWKSGQFVLRSLALPERERCMPMQTPPERESLLMLLKHS